MKLSHTCSKQQNERALIDTCISNNITLYVRTYVIDILDITRMLHRDHRSCNHHQRNKHASLQPTLIDISCNKHDRAQCTNSQYISPSFDNIDEQLNMSHSRTIDNMINCMKTQLKCISIIINCKYTSLSMQLTIDH
jgi:hypothetical protein